MVSFDKAAIHEKAKAIVAKMTLEEKAGLCSGIDCWHTKPNRRLNLASIAMMDGPHGLRKQIGNSDNLGIGESVPAVCFPTASALACSFDRDLVFKIGKAIGEECRKENVSMVLGPGACQKRSPLCGRNFEYYSEDPTVSGELAAAQIRGIESTGTAASLKHFAVNNQEKRRMTIDAVIDERALHETYLKTFEIAVIKGHPECVMGSYNRINGVYSCENKKLLTDTLREKWGFDGFVVSDWGAVHDRILGIKSGLDLEMPSSKGYNDAKIVEAVRDGKLLERDLDKCCVRLCEFILKSMEIEKEPYECDIARHHNLAIEAETKSAVLLKNSGELLPLKKDMNVAIIGQFAKTPRFQGAGSSKINPIKVENPLECILNKGVKAEYSKGYNLYNRGKTAKELKEQEKLLFDAVKTSKGKDAVLIFAGLPEGFESEGFDRTDLSIPKAQTRLIRAISAVNPNIVVVLFGGAPMELGFIKRVKSVLLMYLGGEGVGKATTGLLFGDAVPCGKLAETWPMKLSDTPCFRYFPGGRLTSEYRESIYVGYRYYEKAKKPVLFPFGHGLSYTRFRYDDLKVEKKSYSENDKINLSFTVENCGEVEGEETAFVFTSHKSEKVFLPEKELREFRKVKLAPKEKKTVSVTLNVDDLGFYNTKTQKFYTESGSYNVIVGSSSRNCPLLQEIEIESKVQEVNDLRKEAPFYYNLKLNNLSFSDSSFRAVLGREIPESNPKAARPFTLENTLEDTRSTLVGRFVIRCADMVTRHITRKAEKGQEGMMTSTFREMPFFAMLASGSNVITEKMMEGILDIFNKKFFRGLIKLIKRK